MEYRKTARSADLMSVSGSNRSLRGRSGLRWQVTTADGAKTVTSYVGNQTTITSNQYALPTSTTNALNQITSSAYDYNLDQPLSTTDVNGQTTGYGYNDALDRLTEMDLPNGGKHCQRSRARHCATVGPGSWGGTPVNQADGICAQHDQCYREHGLSASNMYFSVFQTPDQRNGRRACD